MLIRLHPFVVRTAASFRTNPGDDLIRIGNVARLAMDAVRRIQLEVLARAARIVFHFIDVGRAKELAGVAIFLGATVVADVEVRDL